jgi:glycine/D-amino acid oxidase-like deaminating enzyme
MGAKRSTALATFAARTFRPSGAVQAAWLREALAAESEPLRQDDLPGRADVCIVGGGFTGLWTALALKDRDPALEVVLVDAGLCGSGASGRNGGFVMTAWSKFASLVALCGVDDALRYARATDDAVGDIGRFCDEHGIDAGFRQDGWLWGATSPAQAGAWQKAVDATVAAGASPFEQLEPAEFARRAGSPTHVGGVFEAAVATVQPARLARGLAALAQRRGVRVVEHTAMTALHADAAGGARVSTTGGDLTAGRVVLAIAAWAAAVPALRGALVAIASDVVISEPVPDRLDRIGWQPGVAISDSRRLVNYYRRLEDGRIVFGKGGGTLALAGRIGPTFHRASARADDVAAQLRHLYPALSDVRIAGSWRGAVDYSASGLPFVCELPGHPQVLVAAGFSGNGVGPSYLAGKALAARAVGERDDVVPRAMQALPPVTLPPEPLRYAGGLLVRAATGRKEDVEDLGRRPGRVVSALAGLDPTGFVDRGAAK